MIWNNVFFALRKNPTRFMGRYSQCGKFILLKTLEKPNSIMCMNLVFGYNIKSIITRLIIYSFNMYQEPTSRPFIRKVIDTIFYK